MAEYTGEQRYEALAAAVAKHLKVKPEDVLNVGYVKGGDNGHYAVLLAVRREGRPTTGRREYIDAGVIGRADKVAAAYFEKGSKGKK